MKRVGKVVGRIVGADEFGGTLAVVVFFGYLLSSGWLLGFLAAVASDENRGPAGLLLGFFALLGAGPYFIGRWVGRRARAVALKIKTWRSER